VCSFRLYNELFYHFSQFLHYIVAIRKILFRVPSLVYSLAVVYVLLIAVHEHSKVCKFIACLLLLSLYFIYTQNELDFIRIFLLEEIERTRLAYCIFEIVGIQTPFIPIAGLHQ